MTNERAAMPAEAAARARMRRVSLALVLGGVLSTVAPRAARAWNPLKSAARSAATGAVEAIQPVLAATIDHTFASGHELVADVDRTLDRSVDHVQTLAGVVLTQADDKLAARVSQIDGTLEKRILQVEHAAGGVVRELNEGIKKDLAQADEILASRIHQVDGVVHGALTQADAILAERIDQLDEVVGRRLGNVDVIATKQRLAIEQTLLRVAVLIGLVVFVVIVLVRLWRRYGEVTDHLADDQPARRWLITRALAASLGLQVGAAAVAAGVLFVLYQRLPMGAALQAQELVAQHQRALEESLATFEFARVRFHASQLEVLMSEDGRTYRAMAAKGELMRDVLARPTLLSSASGISSVMERVQAVERLLGDRGDADLLVVKALVTWRVGQSRRDEHEAASLCARALRLRPQGFALAPLARAYVQDFLNAPYFDAETPLGQDAESSDDLRAVLTAVEVEDTGSPLATTVALDELMRTLDRASSQAYVEMLQAHAAALRAGGAAAGDEARRLRTAKARQVVAAWDAFDRAVEGVPGLAGTAAVLAVFRLNDAPYSRAKWFALQPDTADVAPLLGSGDRRLPPELRVRLAPPRIAWSARYGSLLGRTRDLLEFQESARWKRLERETQAFDRALVALLVAGPGADQPQLSRRAALEAARLGLYVDGPSGGARVPYAVVLVGDLDAARAAASGVARAELDGVADALALRAPTLALPAVAAAPPPASKRTTAMRSHARPI
jgi:hypothetical protein